MKFLALNTSFDNTYVVAKNENMEYTKVVESKLKQSENVLQVIDQAQKMCGSSIRDLDAISCVIGPGSFTGIRIGLALVKGFLLPYDEIKFIPITSFELMLKEARKKNITGTVTCVINALSGKIFVQSFDENDNSLECASLKLGEDIDNLVGTKVGLKEENLSFCDEFIEFSAETLRDITIQKFNAKEFFDTIEPLYIRKSQAEDELEKKRREND